MPYSRKRIEAEVKKSGSVEGAAKSLGRPINELRKIIAGEQEPSKPGRTLADFRANYDKAFIVPRKIRDQLQRMGSSWLYEVDFARAAGLPLQDLGSFRDQFAGFVVQLREGRRAWAGTKSLANQMRSML